MERTYILKVLEEQEWIIEGSRGAAAILGLKPSTLRSRMQKLNIRKPV
jgi:transcriptional regulator with GAF, ATPase, and Fis domain